MLRKIEICVLVAGMAVLCAAIVAYAGGGIIASCIGWSLTITGGTVVMQSEPIARMIARYRGVEG